MQLYQKNDQIVFYSSRTLFIVLLLLATLPICGVLFGTTIWIKLIALGIAMIYLYFILFVYFKRITIQPNTIIIEYPLRLTQKKHVLASQDVIRLFEGPEKNIAPGTGTALVIFTKKRKYYINTTDFNMIREAISLFYSPANQAFS